MFANPNREYNMWDYLIEFSVDRYSHLRILNQMSEDNLKIAFRDINENKWTKHKGFYKSWTQEEYQTALDIHRSLLPNEILIESDYPTYQENYEAIQIVGKIIEEKGFIPHYYYSGNKSIHISIYFDFKGLLKLPMALQNEILEKFRTKNIFIKKFIEWLRIQIISCFGTEVRKFDSNLVKDTHLIRAELSRNKLGYKTFLGYTYKDISFIPQVCNETNKIYPELGKIILSSPKDIDSIINEFLHSIETKNKKSRVKQNNGDLRHFFLKGSKLRPCVEFMLSNEFSTSKDGYNRSLFVLSNELKKLYDPDTCLIILRDWNERLGNPIEDKEIIYRVNLKNYTLGCDYIHNLLRELGFTQQFH
jgi:hypothetical protein